MTKGAYDPFGIEIDNEALRLLDLINAEFRSEL